MDSKEVEKIQAETKQLLDKFSKSLEKVKAEESNVERESDRREEREEKGDNKANETFRKLMFENAPMKDEDFIIAEKKSW